MGDEKGEERGARSEERGEMRDETMKRIESREAHRCALCLVERKEKRWERTMERIERRE